MIIGFICKETQRVWHGEYSKKYPPDIQNRALNKLSMLDAAKSVLDLKIPPGNRLEKMKGDQEGRYSIRINQQWRICFVWREGNAYEVEIIDYH